MYKNAVSMINLQSDENILDIGYGNGHLLEMIYKKHPVNLYGIDISSDAKEMAAKKNQKNLWNMENRQGLSTLK